MNEFSEQELLALKKKASKFTGIAIGAFALCFLAYMLFGDRIGPIAVLLFAIVIVFVFLAARASKEYSKYYKEYVVKNMTLDDCEFLDDVKYEPNMGISPNTIKELGVISWDRFYSNDLITATYKGVSFIQSDVHMIDVSTDSEGHDTETTVFKGRWLIFDFNKDFNWDLQLVSKGFGSAHRIGSGLFNRKGRAEKIEMESTEFNKMFKVFAQDEHEAFYILTPQMMDRLLGLKRDLNCPLMLVFKGGVLHIAVYNREDAFEGKLFGKLDLEEEKRRMFSDMKLITDFVDILALERDIYKH